MSLRTQIIVAVVVIIIMISIWRTVQKNKLQLKYALLWFIVGTLILILDIFPALLGKITQLFGIGLPVNMLFFLGFCLALVIMFAQTMSISHLRSELRKLVQETALLEKRLSGFEENEDAGDGQQSEDSKSGEK